MFLCLFEIVHWSLILPEFNKHCIALIKILAHCFVYEYAQKYSESKNNLKFERKQPFKGVSTSCLVLSNVDPPFLVLGLESSFSFIYSFCTSLWQILCAFRLLTVVKIKMSISSGSSWLTLSSLSDTVPS